MTKSTEEAREPRRPTWLMLGTLLVLLLLTVATMGWAWNELGTVAISVHGLIALGLGIGVTLLLGVALMTLVFISNRRGYDDGVFTAEDLERSRRPGRDGPDP